MTRLKFSIYYKNTVKILLYIFVGLHQIFIFYFGYTIKIIRMIVFIVKASTISSNLLLHVSNMA